MKVKVAKSAGFCFGVGRAVKIAMELEKTPVYTLGSLVHNRSVTQMLAEKGVFVANSHKDIPKGQTVILRSHGVPLSLLNEINECGLNVIDATCPCVSHIHDIIYEDSNEGRTILIFGDATHPEVTASAGWGEKSRVFVFSSLDELAILTKNHPEWHEKELTIVSQTTAVHKEWETCTIFLKKLYTRIKILDTICKATYVRQSEACELSKESDMVIVVGDSLSANTKSLAEVCRNANPTCKTIMIQNADELNADMYSGFMNIGVTAGASTPALIIEEVVLKMTQENMNSESMESFEQMLESSFKTLNTGDKVTGVITAIASNEIHVDLGTKHAGYIPLDELSYDPAEKLETSLKVGDEIEVFVVRVNDVEGTAMLSRKRLETVSSWEAVEAAVDNQAILEGVVVEENKGGVVVSIKGVRVFVPASQTGLPKDAQMSDIMKKRVKLRITEFNRARRRVVGSIRHANQEVRRMDDAKRGENAAAIWESIAEGTVYQGVVKSLTSFGAFVDIGGVDGMVHVSELSWNRVKLPSDVLTIGDSIEVYVLSFDKEKKKISLGHRKQSNNPWNKFIETYKVGDVKDVKVVKLMPFGAFAEIVPGVDGLIHISQLSDRRIGKPEEAVKEGQVVQVKITEIDLDKKKVSLSIRAMMEPAPVAINTPDEIVATSEAE